jgi:pimeloyl-ACP methyl ester carboxylesterase
MIGIGAMQKERIVHFLPGFGSDIREPGVALPVIEALARKRCKVIYAPSRRDITFAFRGDKDWCTDHLIEAQASAALDVIEEQCGPSIHDPTVPIGEEQKEIIIGHSLGAPYAIKVASQRRQIGRMILLAPASIYDQSRLEMMGGLIKKTIHSLSSNDPLVRQLAVQQAFEALGYFGIGPNRWRLIGVESLTARTQLLDDYLVSLFYDERNQPIRPDIEFWAVFPEGDRMFKWHDIRMMLRRFEQRGVCINSLRIKEVGHDAHFWAEVLANVLENHGLLTFKRAA